MKSKFVQQSAIIYILLFYIFINNMIIKQIGLNMNFAKKLRAIAGFKISCKMSSLWLTFF